MQLHEFLSTHSAELLELCVAKLRGNPEDLFKPFVRGNHRRSTGLGLAITREAITALGGAVGVRDMPGQGCVFSIKLRPRAMSCERLPRLERVPELSSRVPVNVPVNVPDGP